MEKIFCKIDLTNLIGVEKNGQSTEMQETYVVVMLVKRARNTFCFFARKSIT